MDGYGYEFYVDPSRCIGCKACENACAECETHKGTPLIHVDYIDRAESIATVPTVCMHCLEPTCALVCPADAIKQNEEGVVLSSLKPRCVACSNCVLACPFGVPRMMVRLEQMMKCDMCFDRTSVGLRPMCATVCPSRALAYVPPATIGARRERPVNEFRFGNQVVVTKVFMMAPPEAEAITVDVVDYMWEEHRA
jgi:Fe-S-cluster-containing dehydrogenase component